MEVTDLIIIFKKEKKTLAMNRKEYATLAGPEISEGSTFKNFKCMSPDILIFCLRAPLLSKGTDHGVENFLGLKI